MQLPHSPVVDLGLEDVPQHRVKGDMGHVVDSAHTGCGRDQRLREILCACKREWANVVEWNTFFVCKRANIRLLSHREKQLTQCLCNVETSERVRRGNDCVSALNSGPALREQFVKPRVERLQTQADKLLAKDRVLGHQLQQPTNNRIKNLKRHHGMSTYSAGLPASSWNLMP